MTQIEQQKAAATFAEYWADKGDEKQETQRFWISLLGDVLGINSPVNYIEFEKRVQLKHTSFIDGYIAPTKVLIEQKGSKIDLHKSYEQSDGSILTPYEQAKRYVSEMKSSEKPRWIVVCNFTEFLIYDLETPSEEPQQILLKDLPKELYRLQFLIDTKNENIRREEEISLKAGLLVGKLYDALYKEYINPNENSLRSLNILCVRIVFCLYAEDVGLFTARTSFEDYIRSMPTQNVRKAIIELFRWLDTKPENRDKYETTLTAFPYINGGLFRDETIEIPNFTDEIIDVIVNHCAPFNWSEISPTIFGAVFESTLNPETRRKGGMHYTSIENIHKVIDPLFMDALWDEFNSIVGKDITQRPHPCLRHPLSISEETARGFNRINLLPKQREALIKFQEKLGSLTFLDPACGSGNFLTETYLSLRRLENKIIYLLNSGEKVLGFDFFIKVHIDQFYGIEINDFAVTVAKTALWIAESQMIMETESIISQNIDFLPLTTNAFIVEGNALRMDWETLKQDLTPSADAATPLQSGEGTLDLFSGFTTQTDGKKHHYDYIMGNPPFVGYAYQSKEQKEDLQTISKELGNNIDYVVGWYFKAAMLMKGTNIKCAFVSTNSITQGEQVAAVWKPLFEKYNIQINFAWRTFRWDSESTEKAHVHCVIVGFSAETSRLSPSSTEPHPLSPSPSSTARGNKCIYNSDGTIVQAKNINGYLLDAPNVFIDNCKKPLCDVPEMIKGSIPVDDGNFFLTDDEKRALLLKEPNIEKYIRKFYGAREFLHDEIRWCLWLVEISPKDIQKSSFILNRIKKIKDFRLASSKAATRKYADYPTRFMEIRQPNTNYVLVPSHSSENRGYIPMGFEKPDVICGNANFVIPNATLFHFGVLESSVHMAWMRIVCGRLKSDYRYSNTIVYNNFPWPQTKPPLHIGEGAACRQAGRGEVSSLIEQTAQAILDARAKYPDCSLADLYDETTMPPELRKAHQANDKAVMAAYGWKPTLSESEIVAELFKMYEEMAGE